MFVASGVLVPFGVGEFEAVGDDDGFAVAVLVGAAVSVAVGKGVGVGTHAANAMTKLRGCLKSPSLAECKTSRH